MDSASAASDVNDIVWIIVGSVGALVAIGVSIDVALRSSRAFGRKRPVFIPVRVLTLLLCSYGCLLPGLVLNLFSAGVVLNLFGVKMVDLSESMIALVQRMFDHRMYAGAILVAVYALVIPAVKLVLIVLSMVFQRGGKPRLHHARRCIAIVRLVSKWASPDMFAYILMTTLFRSLNKPPKLTSEADLGLGFTCFCVFCALSTLASLGLALPDDGSEEGSDTAACGPIAETGIPAIPASAVDRRRWLRCTTAVFLSLAFVVLFGFGIVTPCMTLRLDMNLLYAHRPALKPFAVAINKQNLPALLNSEVSIRSCMACLSDWLAEGNANGAIAFAMYAVFVLVVPLLHVLALLAWALCREPCPLAVRLSRTLGKLSMLDVSMMGVVVIVLALTNLRAKGTVVALGPGIGPLIGAELCRYALGFIAEPRVAAADMAPIVKGGSSPSPCSQEATLSTSTGSEYSEESAELPGGSTV